MNIVNMNMNIKLTLLEPQLGTVPKSKEVYKTYILGKLREEVAAGRSSKEVLEERQVEELETVAETEEKGWTGFHQDDEGLFIYDYMIRGFLKNAAKVIETCKGKEDKLKNSRGKIDQAVFVFPRRIHFMLNGKNVQAPDGVIERPLRAETMQGPRVCLAKSDKVAPGSTLEFQLKILPFPGISTIKIEEWLDYGQFCGLGQFRNGSYGRFSYEILK